MSITDLSLLFSTLYKSLNVGKEPFLLERLTNVNLQDQKEHQ
jgi:hypothetical protein